MALSAIDGIRAASAASPLVGTGEALPGGGKGFGALVGNFVRDVGETQRQADTEIARLAAGKTDNVHRVMMALGKAELSFNYMLEVRAKLLDAYHEVMRMQL